MALGLLGACSDNGPAMMQQTGISGPQVLRYRGFDDDGHDVPAIPGKYLNRDTVRRQVSYWTHEKPGTVIVDPYAHYLYLIEPGNRAMRYTVAVGEQGRAFAGTANIAYGREWPRWTPTSNMLKRDPKLYDPWRGGMEGGAENPLGARALYLYKNGHDTLYRIHGTPYPWSVGHSVSSGCIRLFQQDIIDLYKRVDHSGTRVVVLTKAQSGKGTMPPQSASASRSTSKTAS